MKNTFAGAIAHTYKASSTVQKEGFYNPKLQHWEATGEIMGDPPIWTTVHEATGGNWVQVSPGVWTNQGGDANSYMKRDNY